MYENRLGLLFALLPQSFLLFLVLFHFKLFFFCYSFCSCFFLRSFSQSCYISVNRNAYKKSEKHLYVCDVCDVTTCGGGRLCSAIVRICGADGKLEKCRGGRCWLTYQHQSLRTAHCGSNGPVLAGES